MPYKDPAHGNALRRAKRAANPANARAQQRAYRAAHPEYREKQRAANRAYYAAHRDKSLAYLRAWRTANREKMVAGQRKWDRENRAHKQQIDLAWQRANPDKVRAYHHNRKARVKGVGGKHTSDDIKRQYEKQSGLCYWCETAVGKKYHVDHVVPIIRGGTNDPSNIVIACPLCNLSKGTKMPEDFVKARHPRAA